MQPTIDRHSVNIYSQPYTIVTRNLSSHIEMHLTPAAHFETLSQTFTFDLLTPDSTHVECLPCDVK